MKLHKKILSAAFFSMAFTAYISAQQSYTFTTAGATGSLGPSQVQVNAAYNLTNLNGSVSVNNGIQSFTVPNTGLYALEITGASGGNRTSSPQRTGGNGAFIRGEFNFTQGDVLTILVGQKGVDGANTASGGGGSFVVKNNVLLIAAGGGGGATGDNNAADASLSTSGTNDFPGGSIPGGTNGSGGGACSGSGGSNHGGGGGGYLGDGAISTQNNAAGGGLAYVNGGIGGASAVPGAFGGGGGATKSGVALYGGGGGGGGYSGGAGGQQINYCTSGIGRSGGGGGGSYNTGSNPTSSVLTTQGDGIVILKALCFLSLNYSSDTICNGESVELSTDAVSGISWNTGATSNSISVTPSVTSIYSVMGTTTANCIASSNILIVVNQLPEIAATSQPTTLCVGLPATLSATGADTYTWSNTEMVPTTTVNPVSNTVYTVSGTSTAGCVSETTVEVDVSTVSLTATNNTVVCAGEFVQLSAAGAVTYTWSNGSLFSFISVSPPSDTSYIVNATDIHNCLLTKVIAVTVNTVPAVSVSALPASICKGETTILTATGADSYTWNASVPSNTLAVTPMIDVVYQYSVTGTSANGCTDSEIFSLSVNRCTGINENGFARGYKIFPNPSRDKFILETGYELETTVIVTDINGKTIQSLKSNDKQMVIDLGATPAGVYFAKVKCNGEESVLKLVKE